MTSKEQKRPADIFEDALDYLWNGLGLEGNGWKRLKKGDFKKKMKNGLTYQIWFDRSHYNYIDYEIGHGNVEVGFSCIIKQGDDYLYFILSDADRGPAAGHRAAGHLPAPGQSQLPRLHRPLRGRPRGGITAGLRPLHRGGGLQLVHLCAGADGGTVRNGGADGGVPPSGRIARNAGVQGEDPYRKVAVLPVPCQRCGSCLGLKPHQRGTGPGGGTLCAGQAADRTMDAGG